MKITLAAEAAREAAAQLYCRRNDIEEELTAQLDNDDGYWQRQLALVQATLDAIDEALQIAADIEDSLPR